MAAALLISGSFFCLRLLAESLPSPLFGVVSSPRPWEFVAFHRRIPFSSAFENPQGIGAIGTATPFLKILLGTQSRNLFLHGHIDELV